MTNSEFKIWLITHGYTQASLAKRLSISAQTISTYNNNGRYPVMFQLALKGLEK